MSTAAGGVRGCVCVCLWPSDGGGAVLQVFNRHRYSKGEDKSTTLLLLFLSFSKYTFIPIAHVFIYHSEPSVSHKQHVLVGLSIYSLFVDPEPF